MPASERPPLRVGYVVKMYPRFSETFILNEVLALEGRGLALEVFSLRAPADGRFHGALADVQAPVSYLAHTGKVTQLWPALQRAADALPESLRQHLDEVLAAEPDDAAQALELACLVVERDIQHLHAHFASVATAVARLAARLAGITYSFTAHAKDIFHDDVDHEQLAVKIADAAAVITVSDFNVDWLQRRYASGTDILRIYNGLDLDVFAKVPYTGRPRRVVGLGRLVEKKGFRHLIDAVAILRKDGVDVVLDLVGSGPEEAALRRQVGDLALEDGVVFHGALPQARAREVVSGAAVLAAPCVVGDDGNRDGLPTVLLEALALGTPVVATPVTGIPEAVADGRSGLLVAEGDAAALAMALHRILDDPSLAQQLAHAGREHVEANFDAQHSAAQLHEVFLRAAAPARVA